MSAEELDIAYPWANRRITIWWYRDPEDTVSVRRYGRAHVRVPDSAEETEDNRRQQKTVTTPHGSIRGLLGRSQRVLPHARNVQTRIEVAVEDHATTGIGRGAISESQVRLSVSTL